jgi:hypothetical protein
LPRRETTIFHLARRVRSHAQSDLIAETEQARRSGQLGDRRVDRNDGLLAAVRNVEKERNEMRAALEKLQAVLTAARGS